MATGIRTPSEMRIYTHLGTAVNHGATAMKLVLNVYMVGAQALGMGRAVVKSFVPSRHVESCGRECSTEGMSGHTSGEKREIRVEKNSRGGSSRAVVYTIVRSHGTPADNARCEDRCKRHNLSDSCLRDRN
jgi:hypothetical protein